jgi:hypothetical protein
MQFPNDSKDRLIFAPSISRSPVLLVLVALYHKIKETSLPAKSIIDNVASDMLIF